MKNTTTTLGTLQGVATVQDHGDNAWTVTRTDKEYANVWHVYDTEYGYSTHDRMGNIVNDGNAPTLTHLLAIIGRWASSN